MFKEFKEKQRKYYNEIGSVKCPILHDDIHFLADGFHHLVYETSTTRHPRKIKEQALKLNCLDHATEVIKSCVLVSQRHSIRTVKGKKKALVEYELVHEVKPRCKIRVIARKLGEGKIRFRSVMPHNKEARKHMNGNKKHSK